LFSEYSWPGNVRELKNISERIVLSAENGRIDLPAVRLMVDELRLLQEGQPDCHEDHELLRGTFQDIKRKVIRRVLQEEGWNKSRTARRLAIDRMTVDRFENA